MKAARFSGKFTFAILIIIFSIIPNALCQEWGNVEDSEWEAVAPADYPEANVLIMFDIGKMEVTPDGILLHRHVRAKILNKAGINEIGDITFKYYEGDDIKKLKAQTIDTSGKKHKVDKKNFFTKTTDDAYYVSFAFPSLDSGCIVEYQYTNSNDRFYRLDSWRFHNEFYTLKSRVNVVLWPGFDYTTAVTNMSPEQQQPVVEKLPNMEYPSYPLVSYTWEMDNLPPIKDEPYMSFEDNYISSISSQIVSYQFGRSRLMKFIDNWKDLGQKSYDFIHDYVEGKYKGVNTDEEISKLVDSLTTGLRSNKTKAKSLYDYVKDKIQEQTSDRYFSNESLGGLLDTRVGTGDEKNILLYVMLNEAKIPAWPVLIGTRDEHVFNPQIYHSDQFNHMIVKAEIGLDPVFMDASYKYYPYGTLPPNSRVVGGCQIENKNSQVIRIKYDSPVSTNMEHTAMHYHDDGTVSCSTSVNLDGYFAARYAREYEESEAEKFVKDNFLDNLDTPYELLSTDFENDNSGSAVLSFTYTLDEYAVRVDNNVLIVPVRFFFKDNPFKSEKRFFPIDFNYPRQYMSTIEISSDNAFNEYIVPDPEELSVPGGAYSNKCMCDGSKITVVNNLLIERPIFPQDLYDSTRVFFDEVASSSLANVTLIY